ncbi:MAG: hypothetical protein ACR2NM_01295, partial [Bythopirellula sp.]
MTMIIGFLLWEWSVVGRPWSVASRSFCKLFLQRIAAGGQRTINKKAPRTAEVLGAGKRNSKSSDYLRTSSGPATKKVASKDKPEEITESSHVASIVGSFC